MSAVNPAVFVTECITGRPAQKGVLPENKYFNMKLLYNSSLTCNGLTGLTSNINNGLTGLTAGTCERIFNINL